MNKSSNNIDRRLTQLGDWLQAKPSFSASHAANERLASLTAQSRPHRPLWIRPRWGIAACLVVGLAIWCTLTAPNSLTYADVQKSLDDKPWVMIRYQSGAQEWINLRQRRNFYVYPDERNFNVGMRDHVQGLWRVYHQNWGRQIHEEPFTPQTYPQTPWEYAVGGWDSRGPSRVERSIIEKSPDTLDGHNVIRFETYDLGPSDLRVLARTVWADPETRLPVCIRKYKDPQRNEEPDTGDFSFPETGPETIYDLNAPRNVPVVTNFGVIEPAVQQLVDTAKRKQRQYPADIRIVEMSDFWINISYRWQNRLRKESFGRPDASRDRCVAFRVPEDVPDVRDWARQNLSLLRLVIFDGSYEYTFFTTDERELNHNSEQPVLHVESLTPDWSHILLRPLFEQWSYVSNVGPMRVLPRQPDLPPKCALLRYEGLDLRRDWVVDTQRDNICLKRTQYRKPEQSDTWILDGSPTERSNWVQLPTGQWYAQTIRTSSKPSITTVQVDPISESEMTAVAEGDIPAFFDGEKLIEQARQAAAKITFWAR